MTAMQKIAYRRLYKNHGKSVGYWEAWVEPWEFDDSDDDHDVEFSDPTGVSADIVIQYAKTLEGKVTRKIHPIKPKNIGRSNETTCLEQAQLELDSRTKKQLDKGYVHTQEEAKAPSTNTLGLLKPMLATSMDKVKPENIDWNSAWAQPKLDGHRAMFKDGVLYSRQGKVIDLPHITNAIKAAGIDNLHLDGELYLHGKTLQQISSLVKRHQEGTEDLAFYIYDVVDDSPWPTRISRMSMQSKPDYEWPMALKTLVGARIRNAEELEEFHERQLAAGYEGTMLRHGSAGYEDGKRSHHLLKLKNFKDAEFQIVGYERGVPYVTGKGVFEVPVWVLDAGNGKTFTATAQGDKYRKNELWETRDEHIGKQLTVKFHYFSKDGIPQLPVSLRFREDI